MTGAWAKRAFVLSLAATVVSGGLAAATRWDRRLGRAAGALAAGRAVEALKLADVPATHRSAEAHYLRGTALLELGRDAEAADALTDAFLRADAPELRRRALHNLALARLRMAAVAARPGREVQARASVVAGREALRMRPGGPGTRWNLALAGRLMGDGAAGPTRDQGGVGIVATSGGGGQGEEATQMTTEQALGILDALRSDEATSLARDIARVVGGERTASTKRGPRW